MFKKWFALLAAVLVLPLAIAACQPAEPEVVERIVTEVVTEVVEVEGTPQVVEREVTRVVTEVEEREVIVEPEPEPVAPVDRMGAWIDTVVFIEEPSADAAVNRLDVGEIDLYAFQVTNPEVADSVAAAPNLDIERSFGSYSELTFNPAGPIFEGTGALNPFAVPRIREAMNWLIDRDFIAEEIHGGMAVPRWHPFNIASNDYATMADAARALELQYAYNMELAQEVITEEMEALGAELVGGVWQYEGEPVEIIVLIRTEDERLEIGDYVANQLEDIGFTTTRLYRTAAEASPIWIAGDPNDGEFHIYTGGWITTVVPRNLAGNFAFFYTDTGLAFPLWQNYVNDPEFYELAQALDRSEFRTVEERYDMMARALELAMEDSIRMWLIDRASITPRRTELEVAADLYGGVSGSWLWPVTIRRSGEVGGSVRVAMPSLLTEPWNPLDGSNWIYDMMVIRATGEMGHVPDPFTGLWLPRRFESAEVIIEEGLPVFKTHDWVDLEFAAEIVVPDDAWADWDPVEQRFLTAAEVYTVTETVARKSIVYYPDDLFDTVTWHDGSPLSIGDFLMGMILTFDRGQEGSFVYDPAKTAALNSFMAGFRGVRIVSEDPLIIETYSNVFQPDAENSITSWFPYYAQGPGAWHNLALGLFAEANLDAAFSSAKADANEVEWLSYIAGPTLDVMDSYLRGDEEAGIEALLDTGAIPYEPTLGQYITADEAMARYENLAEWKRIRGHFWLGTGPFYLERAFPVEGTVIIQRNLNYPDPADRWAGFAAPAIPEIDLDGPTRVTIGEEATYEVWVEFDGAPYPVEDISEVKYLVFDARGELAEVGVAEAIEDGYWEFTLSSDLTAGLEEGSNRLEIVVVSLRVAVPGFDSLLFVTAP